MRQSDVRGAKALALAGPSVRGLHLTASALAVLLAMAGAAFGQEPGGTIVSHGYSTFGSMKYGADFTHFDYVNPDAPKGGEISLWAQGTFDNLNPYSAIGQAVAHASMPYESLMVSAADEVSGSYCLLCETLEYPPGEDWVIFTLREGIRFSDGTPLTAHDVAFSHHKMLDEALPSYAEAVRKLIPTAEALDDRRVKFTFADGVPRKNLIQQAGGVPVFSKAWFERTGARLDRQQMEMSPGSGPYVLGSFQVNEQVVYRRNPEYWAADLPIMRGQANFDSIKVTYFSDAVAALEAFKAGIYTFRTETSSQQWATAYDFPAIDRGFVTRETPPSIKPPAATGFVFNLGRPQFEDLRVRRALGMMFNFEWTNTSLQYGLFGQRVSFWQDTDMHAKGLAEGLEKEILDRVAGLIDPEIRDEVLTGEAFLPHTSDGSRRVDRRNLVMAGRLLDEAGWEMGEGNLRRKDGRTLKLELLSASPAFDRILEPFVQSLQQLGVDASYNRVDPSQYVARVRGFDWDMIYSGYSAAREEGIGLSQRYGSDAVGDVFNPARYSSPAVDRLAEILVDSRDYDELTATVRAIDRILRASYFVVPGWYSETNWLAYYDMFRHPEQLPPYAVGELDFWWYDAGRAAELKAAGALR